MIVRSSLAFLWRLLTSQRLAATIKESCRATFGQHFLASSSLASSLSRFLFYYSKNNRKREDDEPKDEEDAIPLEKFNSFFINVCSFIKEKVRANIKKEEFL